jgi:hypothetical protein
MGLRRKEFFFNIFKKDLLSHSSVKFNRYGTGSLNGKNDWQDRAVTHNKD